MHRVDPRIKIISYILLTIGVFLTNLIVIQVVFSIIVITILIASNVKMKELWKTWSLFILIIVITYPFFFYVYMNDIRLSLEYGFGYAYKFLLVMILTSVIVASTSPQMVHTALTRLKIPYKVSFLISVTFVFFPVIQNEIFNIYQIQKTRGLKLKLHVKHPIRNIEQVYPIVIPAIFLLLKRAWDLSLSLEIRGFGKKRSSYNKLKITPPDVIFISIIFIAFASAVLVNISPGFHELLNPQWILFKG